MTMLQNATLLFARLNECLLCLNPWVFIPPEDLDGQMKWWTALLLSSSYAVFEPVATSIILASAIPPWICTLCFSSANLLAAFVSVALYDHAISEGAAPTRDKMSGLTTGPYRNRLWVRKATALLPSVASSAVLNGSLLLFGQSLYASWIQQTSYITYILGPFALFLNLGCRYADYEIYKRTGRPLKSRRICSSSVIVPAVSCLCIIFIARLGIRTLIGIDPLLAFQKLGPDQADIIYPEPT